MFLERCNTHQIKAENASVLTVYKILLYRILYYRSCLTEVERRSPSKMLIMRSKTVVGQVGPCQTGTIQTRPRVNTARSQVGPSIVLHTAPYHFNNMQSGRPYDHITHGNLHYYTSILSLGLTSQRLRII
jgi:hypothetical protein